ncbi:sulfotransferase family protein [Actinomadura sp. NAK00032]|uniref:sulfotransferase family protein n=1 Tax=Actinomadura sp. NAK00032 TaxID=2742128 RepID=UPI001592265F|nr:sulfotransferase family protein [Actinomadura sp. NAK00032]QKW32844.1 sulfotransferase family protein [Actinomadura sp. NAK00032]
MLEVIGAGFGRTGTLSLRAALERLGFGPCHHMFALLERPEQVPLWEQAAENGSADWDAVYRGYRSTVDWPGAAFWRQLTDRYPHAKVVLTVRDPERWYRSAHDSIYQSHLSPLDSLPPAAARMRRAADQIVWKGVLGGRFADKDHAIAAFTEHNDEVRRRLPSDRLLEFDVGQGWEPLCAFLQVPVPAEPFPRLNDRADFPAQLHRRAQDLT